MTKVSDRSRMASAHHEAVCLAAEPAQTWGVPASTGRGPIRFLRQIAEVRNSRLKSALWSQNIKHRVLRDYVASIN
jgi:hypothetical protein